MFSKEFLEKGLKRVNELQNEMIEKSKQIEGAEEYVKMKMEIFQKDEELRKQLKDLTILENNLSSSFLVNH